MSRLALVFDTPEGDEEEFGDFLSDALAILEADPELFDTFRSTMRQVAALIAPTQGMEA